MIDFKCSVCGGKDFLPVEEDLMSPLIYCKKCNVVYCRGTGGKLSFALLRKRG